MTGTPDRHPRHPVNRATRHLLLAGGLARVMAIPQVEAFLRSQRFLRWLAAEPEPLPPVDVVDDPAPVAGIWRHDSADTKSEAAHHDPTPGDPLDTSH